MCLPLRHSSAFLAFFAGRLRKEEYCVISCIPSITTFFSGLFWHISRGPWVPWSPLFFFPRPGGLSSHLAFLRSLQECFPSSSLYYDDETGPHLHIIGKRRPRIARSDRRKTLPNCLVLFPRKEEKKISTSFQVFSAYLAPLMGNFFPFNNRQPMSYHQNRKEQTHFRHDL